MINSSKGFSLVELLLASSLALVVLLAALRVTGATRTVGMVHRTVSDGAAQLRAVQGVVADDVRRSSLIYDRALSPSWVPYVSFSSSGSGLELLMRSGAECVTDYRVAYTVVSRDLLLNSASSWLRLPDTPGGRLAVLRSVNCGSSVTTRLVADHLETARFLLAFEGTGESADFASDRSSSGGVPIRAVKFALSARLGVGGRMVYVPQSGVLEAVSVSRLSSAAR